MGRKADNQQFRDACNRLGMTPDERAGFSDSVHDLKASGERGTANDRGDFTWDELLAHGRDYLDLVR
ncbi:MAG: hypothetical protein K2X82_13375 [Gemmataceae bacterium]|nr:hypothetical protein [Gemmataceae bacterium]